MQYRAVGNRCAVNLRSLNLPMSDKEALAILASKGFEVLDVDLITLARQCIETSKYRRGARPSDAPLIVDCSSFVKWVYGQLGLWLPRRSIQQRELGKSIPIHKITKGDVIFVSGWIDYYYNDPSDGVGHVGIATGEGSVIHAANKNENVMESSIDSFIDRIKFRGARRYISRNTITLKTPPEREVETSDDIRWIILQSLPI